MEKSGRQAEDLAKRAGAGDEEAFAALFSKYQKLVYTVAFQSTQNAEDAADITQEVFLKVFRSIGAFEGKSALSTWIYRIAANVCIDHSRKNAVRRKLVVSLTEEDAEENQVVERELPDYTYSPDRLFENRELAHELARAMEALPPASREILTLRDIQGLKYEEIALELDIELGTVRSRIARARLRLRELLASRL